MSRAHRYTPIEFANIYLPMKRDHKTREQMAKVLGFSTKSLDNYLTNPKYIAQLSVKAGKHELDVLRETGSKADQIINKGYDLFLSGIEEAEGDGDLDKARKLTIQALKICKTHAETQRVFIAIGNINIQNIGDNPQIVRHVTGERDKIIEQIMKIIDEVCDRKVYNKILERLGGLDNDDNVIDVEGVEVE